jgi:hypothetical protein
VYCGLDVAAVDVPIPGTFQFRTHIEDGTDATTYSTGAWNGIAIGDPDPNRYVIIAIYGTNLTRTVSAVTIGGVVASIVTDATPTNARLQTSNATVEIWKANVPSGATANISIQWSGSQIRCSAGIWTAYRLASAVAVDVGTSNAGTGANTTLTTDPYGFVIAAHGSNVSSTYSWSNVTERYDAGVETSGHSGADAATTGANVTPTATWTGSSTARALVACSFALQPPPPGPSRILDGYSNVTGAWSMSRQLLNSFGSGAKYTTETGVDAIIDQTGNSRHLDNATDTAQPSLQAGIGPKFRTAARFDGIDDTLSTTGFVISASAGYVVVCGIIRAVTTNSPTTEENDSVFGGTGYGLFLRKNNASTYAWRVYNETTTSDGDDGANFASSPIDQVAVFEWRHELGALLGRVTLQGAMPGAWVVDPSPDTSPLLGFVIANNTHGGGAIFSQIDFFEGVSFNVIPNDTLKDALVTNMLAHYG